MWCTNTAKMIKVRCSTIKSTADKKNCIVHWILNKGTTKKQSDTSVNESYHTSETLLWAFTPAPPPLELSPEKNAKKY
jgi:hypothetical protein